jgi:hypothetical protein
MALTVVRKISIFHGRPLSILRSDVDSDLPEEREGINWEFSSSNATYMRAAIHLTHRLEDLNSEM